MQTPGPIGSLREQRGVGKRRCYFTEFEDILCETLGVVVDIQIKVSCQKATKADWKMLLLMTY